VLVSADGGRVLAYTPLSKGCLVVPKDPGRKTSALFVTSLISDQPTETNFFTSMHYGLPVFVVAGGKTWKVDGASAVIAR
jgi:hypothetical protein